MLLGVFKADYQDDLAYMLFLWPQPFGHKPDHSTCALNSAPFGASLFSVRLLACNSLVRAMADAVAAARHVWTDPEELLLDRAITRYLEEKHLTFAGGHRLESKDLWNLRHRGGAKNEVLSAIAKEFREPVYAEQNRSEAEKKVASVFTDAQVISKIDNMLKNKHWGIHNDMVRRSNEQRQGKRNQSLSYKNHLDRTQEATRARVQHHFLKLKREIVKIIGLRHSDPRDRPPKVLAQNLANMFRSVLPPTQDCKIAHLGSLAAPVEPKWHQGLASDSRAAWYKATQIVITSI